MPTVRLTCEPVYTFLSFSDMPTQLRVDLAGVVRECTSARLDGYQYMPSFKSGRWDGYIRLYQKSYFPTGLMRRVVIALLDRAPEGVSVEVNHPIYPDANIDAINPTMFGGIVLRPYQLNAAKRLLAQGRGIAKMATNAGKTVVIAAICKAINGNVLVVVTSRDLLYQTAERLSGFLGEEVGKVGDGLRETGRVTVSIINSAYNFFCGGQPVTPGWYDCVIYDECHHVSSKTSQVVMMAIPAPYRFGFSGTPLKYADLADLVLIGATGEVIIEVTNEDLVTSGISAKPVIEMVEIDAATYILEGYDDDYHIAYEKYIVMCEERNECIASNVNKQELTTLILVDRIEHGIRLLYDIPGSMFVNGNSHQTERLLAVEKLRTEPGSIVIATNIFGEGVDVPAVGFLVLAGGGKGHIKILQKIGRGMRAKEGDNVLHVLDFVDLTNKYLAEHSAIRAELYEQEGFDVRII